MKKIIKVLGRFIVLPMIAAAWVAVFLKVLVDTFVLFACLGLRECATRFSSQEHADTIEATLRKYADAEAEWHATMFE